MWLFKFLPCALLGCKAPSGPSSAVAPPSVEDVLIDFCLELQAHNPPVASIVTVTVGVVATPVNHVYVTPSYPTATPKAIPSLDTHGFTSPDQFLHQPLSFHDEIISAAYWVQDAGFDVDFRVTPLRVAAAIFLAVFFLGWLHLAYMIVFQNFKLPAKAIKSLLRKTLVWALLGFALQGTLYQMFKKFLVEIRHGLQRRINTALRGFCNVLCAACARLSPFAIHGLVLSFKLLGRFLLWLYRFMDTQLIEHGYTWKSPPVILCKTLPFELYMTLRGCFALLRLRLWLGRNNILADVNLGRDYKQMDSLRELGTMNVYEMADILSEYKNLQIEFVEIKPKIIEEVRKEERDFTIDLGNRTIDLRTSLQCMIADFNWLLFVLDLIMSIRIMEMHGISAIGPWSRQYVRSSMRRYCETPSNGLHYKINQATAPRPLSQSDKNIYADSVNRLLQRNPGKHTHPSLNRKLPLFFVPKLNLLDKNTWALDVHFPDFVKANGSFGNIFKAVNHVDPSQRVATPSNDKSIEDYAARGDVQQWYEDLPARIAEQQQLAHPFYRFAR